MNMEDKYINYLYTMLEKTKNAENAAALRWAIFTLEQRGGKEETT